jgi:predicted nucleotidyltransferase
MKAIKEMNQAELAAFVQNHLRSHGIEVILSGGAVVAIYSKGHYVTKDIDLVNVRFIERRKNTAAMEEIGFFVNWSPFSTPGIQSGR